MNATIHSGEHKGWSVLHWATWFPNPAALDELCRRESCDLRYNVLTQGQRSLTPLDLARIRIQHPELLESANSRLDEIALTIRSNKAAECYAKLRSKGALLSDEVKGYPVV